MNKRTYDKNASKRLKQILFLVLVLGYFAFITFGSHGLITLAKLNTEFQTNIKQIQQLKQSNETLKIRRVKTESDLETIERIAREKYNMIKKGEKVFVLETY